MLWSPLDGWIWIDSSKKVLSSFFFFQNPKIQNVFNMTFLHPGPVWE